ncbi:bone morphogenetic protein receptor type-2-like [Boleophthalmus pectinirostris]|uniref:bone morphogenetic protein receptor type-2-like n=1 Tax=Boleophthalmus pectinirostris TaxID=150288 RepID=UPI00242BC6E2|nr:bone morphogenetic protein receptor type-2-like [Boleophthalmus pectinirostris]
MNTVIFIYGARPRQSSALIAVGTVAGVVTLLSLLFLGYRLLTGEKKLSLVIPNIPEISNSSCVDMEELKLWELIGRGRYSCVYLGTLGERTVAVKVYPSAHKQKYVNECYIYTLLSLRQQPSISHFLCADERVDSEGSTQLLIVMDHYPHGCLSHFLSRTSVDWTSCCRMMHGVTRGLSYLHSEVLSGDESKPALAHRDVSSSHILVRSDLSCVLSHFSLSMSLTRDPTHLHGDGDSVAISEVGTLRYLAPELLAGALDLHEYGTALKQVDVYALGLLFWEAFRRCHDLFPGRDAPHFQLAYESELGQEVSLEHMHMLVVRDKSRPCFPPEWNHNSSVLRQLKETMEDCWDQDAEARLSAHCAAERLCQLSLLPVPTQHTHSLQSHGCWPPLDLSSSRPDVAVDLTSSSSTVERCTVEDISQTASGSAFCFTSPLTGGAVPGVSVCLPLEQTQKQWITSPAPVLPQRPSSLQLLSTASSRERQGVSQHTARPRDRQVQTGVAKMNSVAVLAQAPVSVTMVTGRGAVRMADGSSAGVPTLVTNRLMARGVTNQAGPQEEDPCCSRAPVQLSTTDPDPGLNFVWSPDEQQPLLRSEVTPAGALLLAQRSNANNNNSNIQKGRFHSPTAQKTATSDGTPIGQNSLSFVPVSSPPVHPAKGNSTTKPGTQVTPQPVNCAPFVQSETLRRSCGDQMSVCENGDPAGAVDDNCVEPADRCWSKNISSPDPLKDSSLTAGFNKEEVFHGLALSHDCCSSLAPMSHMSPESPLGVPLSPVSPAHVLGHAPSAPGVLSSHKDMSSDSATAAPDRDRCPSRPCSLDLSSFSASKGSAPHTDSGLSVSGEKIRRRVKTPYTVKKWRPASWVPPTDHHPELLLQATPNCPTISQSKSSMAMFVLGGGANSKPDGLTSF